MHGPLNVKVNCYHYSVPGFDTVVWFMVTDTAERPAAPILL
jgi:hypothetical protein